MNKYKVTIITSAYRASFFMAGLLENVVSQTAFVQCKWVIVDVRPPSTIPCMSLESIVRYVQDYPNIYYERLSPDPSVYGVWNKVIQSTNSDYITNWNCDDRRYPDSIEKQIKFLDNNPQIDLVYNDHIWHRTPNWVPWNNKKVEQSINRSQSVASVESDEGLKPDYSLLALKNENLPHCDPVWRLSLHEKFGYFREDVHSVADYEFWMRCALGGSTFKKLNDVMGIYYVNPQGLSTNRKYGGRISEEMKSIITPLRNQITERLASE